MVINAFLRKAVFYEKYLLNISFIKNEKTNKIIGIEIFKWIVKNTFFKFFNQKLKLKRQVEKTDLYALRHEMTISEIDHLIAFIFVTGFALVKLSNSDILFSATIIIINVLMNLYPSLLQQQNKRRIDKLIKKFS